MSLDNFGDLLRELRRKNPRKRVENSALGRWALLPPLDTRECTLLMRQESIDVLSLPTYSISNGLFTAIKDC